MDRRKRGIYTKQKLVLYFDESVPRGIAHTLTSDKSFSKRFAIKLAEDINRGKSDSDHFQYCRDRGYVLVTLDADFMDDRKYPFNRMPGVIVLSFSKNSLGKIRVALLTIVYFLSAFPFPKDFAGDAKFQVSSTRCIMRGREIRTKQIKTHVINPRDTVYAVGKKFGYFS